MIISFFEEFPNTNNLKKINLITWPTKLYIAAESIEEFIKIKNKIKNKKVKEIIYWPILKFKEGYWISPYSKCSALKRIFRELKNKKIPIMLDLELPTTKNPLLYITQFFNFSKSKLIIRKFIQNYPGNVYLAEYYPLENLNEKILAATGLHYKNKKVKIIKMIYHSMHDFNEDFIIKQINLGKKKYGENYIVSLGTIAKGIKGDEPILSTNKLKKDLDIVKKAKIKEVIIFRLGGLNKKNIEIMKNVK